VALEQQLRTAQSRLMTAKTNLDSAKRSMDVCVEQEREVAAARLIEEAPRNAVVVVQEREHLASSEAGAHTHFSAQLEPYLTHTKHPTHPYKTTPNNP